jgi:pyridoxamine 5'-phosphate oxidase
MPVLVEVSHPGTVNAPLNPDPFAQFRQWLDEALTSGLPEPHAMTVATATRAGRPSARVVLLRGFDARGFVFFTSYESRKGRELAENPFASLVFFWPGLQRQIRVEGRVEKVTSAESDAYFDSRPAGHRLAARASDQSQVIPNRQVLETRMREIEEQYAGVEIPRPDYWGGYRVIPAAFEFWRSGANRLHDRFQYTRQDESGWLIQRLSP